MDSGVPIVATIFGTFGWVVYTISTNIRKAHASRAVANLHSKLLDKCAASQDLVAYLESPSGQKFLESAGNEGSQPWSRILSAMQAGFVLSLVGIAELIVRGFEQNADTSEFLLISGAIALAIGAGFLISATTSFVLSKSWGLLAPSQLPK
ncbi:MAG TPA: hypothetical protein VH601_15000 [Bryobacteraceae bacterium]|jgi:hypothetical protein